MSDKCIKPLLEVCVGSTVDAVSAVSSGADRLELCGALELGGLTPSIGLIEQVLGSVPVPVIVMIRPRAAGFAYSNSEVDCMVRDAEAAVQAGAAGVAFGAVTVDGQIDCTVLTRLVAAASKGETVFHRAFDSLTNLNLALETLIDHGVTRVLTSAGTPTPEERVDAYRRLVEHANERIEILAGGGVTAADATPLLVEAGCAGLHIGASVGRFDASTTAEAAVGLCDLRRLTTGAYRAVDPAQVTKVRASLQQAIEASHQSNNGSKL